MLKWVPLYSVPFVYAIETNTMREIILKNKYDTWLLTLHACMHALNLKRISRLNCLTVDSFSSIARYIYIWFSSPALFVFLFPFVILSQIAIYYNYANGNACRTIIAKNLYILFIQYVLYSIWFSFLLLLSPSTNAASM